MAPVSPVLPVAPSPQEIVDRIAGVTAGKLELTDDQVAEYLARHFFRSQTFRGGDIGSLAVHGTVNDVAMLGAMPLYLSASFILEEGLPLAQLQRIVESMAAASRACGVPVVTGDTKVVERGKART